MQKLSVVLALFALAAVVLADGKVTPVMDCAVSFTLVVDSEQDDGSIISGSEDEKIMHKDGMIYIYGNSTYANISSSVIRCDIKDADGKCYTMTEYTNPDRCEEEYEDFPDPFLDDDFYYNGEPQDTECPDKTATGCKLYCNTTEEICIVINADERLVQLRGDKYNYTYIYKEAPTVNDFVVKKCDGSVLSVPFDICAPVPKSITPKADCASHNIMNYTIDDGTKITSMVTETWLMETGDMAYVKQYVEEENFTVIIRCDMKDDDGKCLYLTWNADDCNEDNQTFNMDSDHNYYYDVDPVDIDCPYEGISGCKKYCNSTDKDCAVFDSEGYMIQMLFDVKANYTYTYLKDGVNPEDFVTERCDGTNLTAPADICGSPAPSAPSSGSASVIEVAVAVVVAAIVVALF